MIQEIQSTSTAADIKRHGKHYTPTRLADFLARRILVCLSGQAHLRVLDPACGDGELLFAVKRVAEDCLPNAFVTLVGYDLDRDAVAVARERASAFGIHVEWHEGDFLQVGREVSAGSFDAVITNPPYVRTQHLGQDAARTLSADFGLKGRIDLTHPFVSLVPSILRAHGVLGLLCSNRFLTTKAGANVRAVLQTSLQPIELFDLGDTKLFGAAVLPAIVIAINQPHEAVSECSFLSAYEDVDATETTSGDLYEALRAKIDNVVTHDGRTISIKVGNLVHSPSSAKPWRLSHKLGDDWLRSVERATWKTFGDVAKIRVGIKTTADSVFISDDWECSETCPESQLLLPLVTHHNVTAWRISERLTTRVLYPYDLSEVQRTLVDMNRYPRAMAHFDRHSERLKGRSYVIAGGREWFEIWVPQRPAMWSSPKIIFPDISVNAQFAYDRSGAVVNGDCYWISLVDIGDEDIAYLMLAVGNSSLGLRFYDEVCGNKLYSGRRRWMSQYVARLPLPNPASGASQELIRAARQLIESNESPPAERLTLLDRLVEEAFADEVGASAESVDLTLF